MTTDLWMLVASALLCLFNPVVYAIGRFSTPGGYAWALGNRDNALPNVPAWTSRAVHAHQNMIENIGPFAILVLVAHVSGNANETTALGATIFFWARLAYLAIYTAGISYLRTMAWATAWAGGVMILVQLFN